MNDYISTIIETLYFIVISCSFYSKKINPLATQIKKTTLNKESNTWKTIIKSLQENKTSK